MCLFKLFLILKLHNFLNLLKPRRVIFTWANRFDAFYISVICKPTTTVQFVKVVILERCFYNFYVLFSSNCFINNGTIGCFVFWSVYIKKISDGLGERKEYDLEKFIEDVNNDRIPYFSKAEIGILPVFVFNFSILNA